MTKSKRNILVTPVVLCVRLPLMAALTLLCWVGALADKVRDGVDKKIPGFRL